MSALKISVITVCYNAAGTIERCIQSVLAQQYAGLEYIIIDGGSTDGTLDIIGRYARHIHRLVTGPDNGIYHAMNKGLALAGGKVIGTLNADDYFAGNDVLAKIEQAFTTTNCDMLYGDLDFVDAQGKVTRKWRSGEYKPGSFNYGWMPPHPTFYVRRELFTQSGNYNPDYGSAADYELMLRFMHRQKVGVYYLPVVMISMQIGGVSTGGIKNRLAAWRNDYKAMRSNGVIMPLLALLLKPFRKIQQYIV